MLHFVRRKRFQQQNALVGIVTQKSVSSGNSRCKVYNTTDHDMSDEVVFVICFERCVGISAYRFKSKGLFPHDFWSQRTVVMVEHSDSDGPVDT